jgi:surface polysaccharide O-acyltransferase-like enzyme
MKRTFLLNGVAILGVLVNHALYWTRTAIYGAGREGTPIYYVWLVLQQLSFLVPSFVFVSGFFLAFALRGHARLSRTVMKRRMLDLVLPYLLWSLVMVAVNVAVGSQKSGWTYLREFVSTGVHGPYYFVPLLLQLYLIGYIFSPLIVDYPFWVLIVAGVVQLGATAVWYLGLSATSRALNMLQRLMPYWTFFHYLPYFVLGFTAYLRRDQVMRFVQRRQKLLLGALVVSVLSAIVEPELLYQTQEVDWRNSILALSTKVYGAVFVLCFLSVRELPQRFTRLLQYLAARSYGIYLVHGPVGGLVARVIRRMAPSIAGRPWLLGAVVLMASLAGPLLLMEGMRSTPLRKAYRVSFG